MSRTISQKRKRLLLLAAICFVVGLLLCVIALLVARGQQTDLFDQVQNEEGNYVFSYEFSPETVKKIAVNAKYADVHLYGNADENRIELINYSQNAFKMTASATTVSFSEQSGLLGLFGSGFQFSGLRNRLHAVSFLGKHKTINLYLTPDSVLKLFTLTLTSGEVSLSDSPCAAEYNLTVDYGSVTAEALTGADALTVVIKEGNLEVKDASFAKHTARLDYGYESLENVMVENLTSRIQKGYFKYVTGRNLMSDVLRLNAPLGRVRVGEDIYENGTFSQGIQYTGISSAVQVVMTVDVADGNILITP